jgi:hypothetical protein
MAGLNNPLSSWLKRRSRRRKQGNPAQAQRTQERSSRHLDRSLRTQRGRKDGQPRWVVAALWCTGLILVLSLGLLGKLAFFPTPTPELAVKDRRPEQQSECEKLASSKLLYPDSYKRVSRFAETADDGAQRTFQWTFTSRTNQGGTGQGAAVCKASNHLQMATVEVRQVN